MLLGDAGPHPNGALCDLTADPRTDCQHRSRAPQNTSSTRSGGRLSLPHAHLRWLKIRTSLYSMLVLLHAHPGRWPVLIQDDGPCSSRTMARAHPGRWPVYDRSADISVGGTMARSGTIKHVRKSPPPPFECCIRNFALTPTCAARGKAPMNEDREQAPDGHRARHYRHEEAGARHPGALNRPTSVRVHR
jgi:hypothetical protein